MNYFLPAFFFQADDGIRDYKVTGVQTCALPIWPARRRRILPRRLSRLARRAARDLRSDCRLHSPVPGAPGRGSEHRQMTTPDDDRRPLILWTIAMSLGGIVLLYTIYLIRDVLLLLYVSGIFAIGFSPIVRYIERQRVGLIGRRLPRWLAILILYLFIISAIVGLCALIFPPLVSQARAFWEHLPDLLARGQAFLIDRGFLQRQLSMQELAQRAPGTGGDTVGRVIGAAWGFFGGIFGLFTILILT